MWHRRAGKDKAALNFTIKRMFPECGGRVGTYFHLFPTYAQGKKIIWDGIDASGQKVLDHFPPEIVKDKNETELQVVITNGSIYQIIGTDKIDSVVGTNPVGCVFSEYALQNPRAWDLLSPILAENDGWAIFNFTPRGHNHGQRLYNFAKRAPSWFAELLTVDDTKRDDGRRVITEEAIQAERDRGMAEELIQQEYYCSFEGYQEGSIYVTQLRKARADGRICSLPWISELPVFTIWDLGVGDATAIWFVQRVGIWLHFIDYYEKTGEAIAHYSKVLKEKPYVYARHYWPHDGRNRDFGGTGQTRRDTGEALGLKPIDIVERSDIGAGIEATRGMFSICKFDEIKCEKGIDAVTEYHYEYDDDRREFKDKPFHNWASNGADALRTGANSDLRTAPIESIPVTTQTYFDPRRVQQPQVISNTRFNPLRRAV